MRHEAPFDCRLPPSIQCSSDNGLHVMRHCAGLRDSTRNTLTRWHLVKSYSLLNICRITYYTWGQYTYSSRIVPGKLYERHSCRESYDISYVESS